MPARCPRLFEPHDGFLLEHLSGQIDDSMLWEIAEADYGLQARDHHAVLRRMRDEGFVPTPDWVPQEVLELIRWSQPDQPDWKPGGVGDRGHWMRAFCCASLLRMAGTSDGGTYVSFNETVAGLVASLDALDVGLWAEAGCFLTWFMERYAGFPDRHEEPFFGVALLLCALRTSSVPDVAIVDLCRWTIDREEAEAQAPFGTANDCGWLHRITSFGQRRETWRLLGAKMASLDLHARSGDAREWVGLISMALTERG